MTVDELVALLRATNVEPVRVQAENRELRRIALVLLTWIGEREELLAFVHAEMDRRWPQHELRDAA